MSDEAYPWADRSQAELVETAGLMGVDPGIGPLRQPAAAGFQAQAELIRRLVEATGALTQQTRRSGQTMVKLTWSLVALTVALTIATIYLTVKTI